MIALCLTDILFFFLYILIYLFFQERKIACYYIPNYIIINLKILVNNIISHAIHQFPWSIGMRISKIFSKHIRSFAKNLDIFNYGIVHHIISYEIIKSFSLSVTPDSFYSLKHVLKSTFISNSFSHIPRIYLVQQTL